MIFGKRVESHGTFKVGLIITAYEKGYHICTGITPRFIDDRDEFRGTYGSLKEGDEGSPLIHYKKINLKTGAIGKSESCCDAPYCHTAFSQIDKEIDKLNSRILVLEGFKNMIDENGMFVKKM